ncbi:hypothetical protein FQN57_003698 [Myotisia sp. PD_48]|nr:hypothetical protein FQN57_003698 [Myotisia sp. PD_48]
MPWASTSSSSNPQSKAPSTYSSSRPITPPEFSEEIRWRFRAQSVDQPSVRMPADPIESNHAPQPSLHLPAGSNYPPESTQLTLQQCPSLNCTSESASPSESTQQVDQDQPDIETDSSPSPLPTSSTDLINDLNSFLYDGIITAVASLSLSTNPAKSIQIISQTLPSPPREDTIIVSPIFAYTPVVQAIQSRLQPGHSPYINIVHAVPSKFSLAALPASPPSTPNFLFHGDDYFTLTVFNSAVAAPTYQHIEPPSDDPNFIPVPYIPSPIVPPFSVNVAVVERYLPPPSLQEYQNLFNPSGPSVLLDRLREISPKAGNLILIYPTKHGAQTFKREYLSPVIDPLLRQLAVVSRLPSDVGMALAHMPAVDHMYDFETMQENISNLCDTLSNNEQVAPWSGTSSGTNFSLVYSEKGSLEIDRKLWTDWYIQQESPRAREILSGCWNSGYYCSSGPSTGRHRSPGERELTPPTLLREIWEALRRRATLREQEEPPLEVGVFVIQRSQEE